MIKNYRMKDYTYSQLKNNVSLPKYQRSLVWDKDRKRNFINTIRNGNPFGVLLIYDDPKTGDFKIIDGLQRFTTLQDYESRPFDYVEIDEVEYFEIVEITQLILNVYVGSTREYVVDQIIDFIAAIFKDKSLDLNQINIFEENLLKIIINTYPEIKASQEALLIQQSIFALWKRISKNISISDLEIPAIIYHGNESELPTIFQRLNTGGTSLTKYEVFASTWANTVLKEVDHDIAKIIDLRYQYLTNETHMQIDNYSEGEIIESRIVSLYEYCFALGKIIKKSAPILLDDKSNRDFDNVESIGFSTLVSFLGFHLRDMSKLNTYITSFTKPHALSVLKKTIVECYKFVEDTVLTHTSQYTKYIEAQVISMAAVWFKMNYDLDLDTLKLDFHPVSNNVRYQFQKYAPFRFFNDIIRGYWAGSGDSKLYEISRSVTENNRYTTPIQESVWESNLIDWMENQLDKPLKTIPAENKMFVSFISRPYIDNDSISQYSCNWIIPRNMLMNKGVVKAFSHIGNIFWIPKFISSKYDVKNQTICGTSQLSQTELKHLYELHHPEKRLIAFADKNDIEIDYEEFIRNRIQYLTKEFLRIIPV